MSNKTRCAVYTRKSTDDGLEQEFNSLDAQRESCEAYIKSQRSLGWMALSSRYDDGGISGGTMVRPALQALLTDIEKGRVDLVVVYKVDRLTRSLSDFARIVDVFDAGGVSFASVTQAFNTTTSMGRLTLNMLLSFAQFEREVTGERIRDKIAASKKKGMWMGGLPSLGYDVRDKKLVVNQNEAATVRTLFRLYLELGTVTKLVEVAHRLHLVTKRRVRSDGRETGGHPFARGNLHQLLANPIYAGQIVHKKTAYPGRHNAIVEKELFDAVQRRVVANAATRRTATDAKSPSLLTGLVYDETGDRLCPTHASKKGRRYRYYISKRLMHRSNSDVDGWRIPAKELDGAVLRVVSDFLRDELRVIGALQLADTPPNRLRKILQYAAAAADDLQAEQPASRQHLLRSLVHHVTLHAGSIHVAIRRSGLATLSPENGRDGAEHPNSGVEREEDLVEITAPIRLKRRGVEAKLVIEAAGYRPTEPDKKLVALVAKAFHYIDDLAEARAATVRELAQQNNVKESDVSLILPLAFLAPDIIESIVSGRQPFELRAYKLKRTSALPFSWEEQRRLLGFNS